MAIILIGLLLRVLVMVFTRGLSNNHDINSYFLFGKQFFEGESIYPSLVSRHPYFPFIVYLGALAVYIQNLGISYDVLVKMTLITFDLANIWLIYLISDKNKKAALLYAINPVPVLVTSFHGQFDSIPILFLLLSYYSFVKKKSERLSMIFASVAVGVKTWPLLFIFPLIKRIKDKKSLLIIPFFPIVLIIIYMILFPSTKLHHIFEAVFRYRGIYGMYGFGLINYFLIQNLYVFKLSTLFILLFVILSILNRKNNVLEEVSDQFVLFFAFTSSIGIQWFMWCIPFFILSPSRRKWIIMTVLILYYLLSYSQWIWPHMKILSDLSWLLSICVWLLFLRTAVKDIIIPQSKKVLKITRLNSVHDRNNDQK